MGSKTMAFLCLMALLLMIATAVETETKGLEESKYHRGGKGGGCRYGCGGGGHGGGGGGGCRHGCCGHGYHGKCRCCSYAGEAVEPGYVAESIKPQN